MFGIIIISKKLKPIFRNQKLVLRQLAFLNIFSQKFFCEVFALLHIRLIECIDTNDRSSSCSSDFPTKELGRAPATLERAAAKLTRGVYTAPGRSIGCLNDDVLFQTLRTKLR